MAIDRGLLDDELDRAVECLVESFADRSICHALIEGLATSLRGRQRTTRDIDFLLDVPQIQLPGLLDDLIDRGFTLDPSAVIPAFVRQHIAAFSFGAVRVDWLEPVLPLYSRALADAGPIPWSEGHVLRVATAEGLILTKMVAFRPQDLVDIETLLTANRDSIDLALIREEWSPFADSEPERDVPGWRRPSIAGSSAASEPRPRSRGGEAGRSSSTRGSVGISEDRRPSRRGAERNLTDDSSGSHTDSNYESRIPDPTFQIPNPYEFTIWNLECGIWNAGIS